MFSLCLCGPAMSWRLVQGVPRPRPETAWIGSSNPRKRDKAVTNNGLMEVLISLIVNMMRYVSHLPFTFSNGED